VRLEGLGKFIDWSNRVLRYSMALSDDQGQYSGSNFICAVLTYYLLGSHFSTEILCWPCSIKYSWYYRELVCSCVGHMKHELGLKIKRSVQ
jgi:hypothetical protein